MPNQLVERPVSQVLRVDRSVWAVRLEIAVDIAVKVALAASLFVAIEVVPDAVDGTAMPLRAALFLASAVLVPVIGWRRRSSPYAHAADALLAAPFLLDTLGNLFGRYDRRPASAVDRRGSGTAYLPTGLPAYLPTGLLAYRPTRW